MAVVRLRLREGEGCLLPRVCMKCVAVAVVYHVKTFSWFPAWVYLLFLNPLPLLGLFVGPWLVRRVRVDAPLCERHRGLWNRYGFFTVGGVVGLSILLMALPLDWFPVGLAGMDLRGFLCLGAPVLLLAWAGVAVVWSFRLIRPQEITEDYIVFKNVSPEFVRAYETTLTYDPRDLDEAVRERWGRKARAESRESHVRPPPGEPDQGREGGEGFTSPCG